MGLPVKNTQTLRDEILKKITVCKNDLLRKSRIGIEDVYKRNSVLKEILIIGCQAVLKM